MRGKIFGGMALTIALFTTACSQQKFEQSNVAGEGSSFNQNSSVGIIGGEQVSSTSPISKSIVAVYDNLSGELCTGSLLSNNIVLTAAHCVGDDPAQMDIIFDVQIQESSPARPVVKAIVSPLWKSRSLLSKNTGDIALLKFSGDVPNGYSAAAIIPNYNLIKNGTLVVLAGFGLSDGVNEKGAGFLRQTTVMIKDQNFSSTEILVDQTSGKGACHGDSGGPAYLQIAGHNFLFAITSRGVNDPKNDCSTYAAYTSLAPYASWIKKSMGLLAAYK